MGEKGSFPRQRVDVAITRTFLLVPSTPVLMSAVHSLPLVPLLLKSGKWTCLDEYGWSITSDVHVPYARSTSFSVLCGVVVSMHIFQFHISTH